MSTDFKAAIQVVAYDSRTYLVPEYWVSYIVTYQVGPRRAYIPLVGP